MDQGLRQAIALHIGQLALTALEAQTQIAALAQDRHRVDRDLAAAQGAEIERLKQELERVTAVEAITPAPRPTRPYKRRKKANGAITADVAAVEPVVA